MLGINLKSDLDNSLSRGRLQPLNYIDAVNVADVFDGGVIPDSFDISDIEAGDITDTMLADASVTTAKLANLAVDNTKLAALAVDAAKLANSAVESTKIANAAVGSAAIASAAIGTTHIANAAILNAHIADATILAAKIGSLNADVITAGTLTGRTVKAIGSGSGVDIWIDSSDGKIKTLYNGSVVGSMATDATGQTIIQSPSNDVFISAGDDIFLSASDDIIFSGDDFGASVNTITMIAKNGISFVHNDDGGSDHVSWINDTQIDLQLNDNHNLYLNYGSYL